MLGFFKKLRLALLKDGKTRQYLTYAFGEILLVTIGILIAIQINSWNDRQKSIKKEQAYLKAYRSDLEANLLELDRVICKKEDTQKMADSLLFWSKGNYPGIPLDTLDIYAPVVGLYTLFMSSEGTIEDIVGSGDVEIIKNDAIRKSIVSWESNLKLLREWERIDQNAAEEGRTYLQNNLPMYRLRVEEALFDVELTDALFNNTYYLNLLENQILISSTLIPLYYQIWDEHWKLLKTIENELN